MPTAAETAAAEALRAMSPARRAAQLFAATVTNAANTATLGGIGYAGDVVRGTPFGDTGAAINAQVREASPFASVASTGIGAVAPTGLAARGIKGGFALLRNPIGARAAELGITAGFRPGVKAAARAAAIPAAILGGSAALVAPPGPVADATASEVAPAAAITQALAAGRAAETPNVQDGIAAFINGTLKRGTSLKGAAVLGGLIPAAIKPGTSQKDGIVAKSAAAFDAIFSDTSAQIAAAVQAGTVTQEQAQQMQQDNAMRHANQLGSLVGADPTKTLQAQLMAQAGDE